MTTVTSTRDADRRARRLDAADGHASTAPPTRCSSLQDAAGWWKGELETNVTMDAEDLLLRQFLGIRTDGADRSAAATWIRSQQRDDGTWANFYGGPGDLSTTVEAYVALRLAGDAPDAATCCGRPSSSATPAASRRSRVFTRDLARPVRAVVVGRPAGAAAGADPLPDVVPLNIYDFGCWARQTVVALTVVGAHRPVRTLPVGIEELRTGAPPRPGHAAATWAGFFERARPRAAPLRAPAGPLAPARRAPPRPSGGSSSARRPTAPGAGSSRRGSTRSWRSTCRATRSTTRSCGPGSRASTASRSTTTAGGGSRPASRPVWDTALAVIALPTPGGRPTTQRCARPPTGWLAEEITVGGDWSVRRPDLAPGGWAFEFANDHYPDIDDTAEVVLALQRVAATTDHPSIDRGVAVDRRDAVLPTAAGPPSTSTTSRRSAASCRSATSAS